MRAFRRPWANPLVQFVVAALLLFALTWWATGVLSRKAGKTEAIADARVTTELLGLGMAEPAIPRKMIEGDAGAVDRFDRRVGRRMFHVDPDLRTVKIWRSDGTIVYSNNTKLIGKKFKLDAEQRDVLENGATEGSLSDLRRAENKFETEEDGLLEVYTQIHSPEGQPLLFEGYYKVETVKQRAAEVRSPFRKITAGGLGAVLLIGLPLIGLLTLRLTRASRARERLMLRAIDASEAERRRIARDLHDGVVQELAGTAFALTGTAREQSVPPAVREDLVASSSALRRSLKQLRSLLVEIHPPGLNAEGLPAALEDLTAQASTAGMETQVSVAGLEGTSEHVVTLVWRVAQEAIRNAVRHAGATHLEVDVKGDERQVRLRVRDDGRGFDPLAATSNGSYGLRGLQSLVEDGGGKVQVDSAPGAGTTVRMVVERG